MTKTFQPLPRTQCGRACKYWTYDMDGSYCGHPKSFAVTCFGLSEDAMSRQGLCFHCNDSEPARDELFEPRECNHEWENVRINSSAMTVDQRCTKCGEEYEKDVS